MSPAGLDSGEDALRFGDAEFRAIANIAQRQFGLNLAESKKPLVYSRLAKRVKAREVSGFPEYLALLDQPGEQDERMQLVSALTTNVTNFFRENHHFEHLRSACLPGLISQAKSGKRVRIWSAGCSSGQEPYSIAMTVLACFPQASDFDVRILATDIDPKIVEKAKDGRYPERETDGLPAGFRDRWTEPATGQPTHRLIRPEVRSLITFGELNLMRDWPFKGPFDAVFCRNVAIYFNQETQQVLWQRFCNMLRPGGHLYIGHSERVTGPATSELTGIGITSYQKSPASKAASAERSSGWA